MPTPSARNRKLALLLQACSATPMRVQGDEAIERMNGKLGVLVAEENPAALLALVVDYVSDAANIDCLKPVQRNDLVSICEGLVEHSPAVNDVNLMQCGLHFPDLVPALIGQGGNPQAASNASPEKPAMRLFDALVRNATSLGDARGAEEAIKFYCRVIDLGVYPTIEHSELTVPALAEASFAVEADPFLLDVIKYALGKDPQEANELLVASLLIRDWGPSVAQMAIDAGADLLHTPIRNNPGNRPFMEMAREDAEPFLLSFFEDRLPEAQAKELNLTTSGAKHQKSRRI
jgi:hypothetical protein